MKLDRREFPTWFVVSVLFTGTAWWGRAYLRLIYHGGEGLLDPLPTLGLLSVAAFAVVWLVSRLPYGERFLRFVLALIIVYLLYYFTRVTVFAGAPIASATKAMAVLAALISAAAAAITVRDEIWSRVRAFVLLLFVLQLGTGHLVARMTLMKPEPVFSMSAVEPLGRAATPTLFLVLDETSPRAAESYVRALDGIAVDHTVSIVRSAGRNTVNAIPAMLIGERFDDVTPCGHDTLCSSVRSLDFTRLSAARADVDVVGFWHPYCSIAGLRTCARFGEAFSRGDLLEAVCAVPQIDRVVDCAIPLGGQSATLERMHRAIRAAPFWTAGGVLYVHLPLPHPSDERGDTRLAHAYAANVDRAADVVADLTRRLLERFPDGFRLIVTSDHSLRLSRWCEAGSVYLSPTCAEGLPSDEGLVPLLTIVPLGQPAVLRRETNLGILR